jgi:peptidoglycan-associated lipoprotein
MHTRKSRGWRASLALAAAAGLALGGCASRPKPLPLAPPGERASAQPEPPVTPPGQQPVYRQILPGSVRDFVVDVGDRVYFDYDAYELRPDGQRTLAAQARWLDRYPAVRVRIEGNCDERGTEEYNFGLGARRAGAVKDFLVDQGVDPGRISTVSYGKDRPIDPGEGEAAWQHNRNAHTAIVAGAPQGG